MTLLFLLALSGHDWWVKETEIFFPVVASSACMGDQGEVYISVIRDSRVIRFDEQGHRVGVVAEKGEGPGDLRLPLGCFFKNGALYVLDPPHIKVFGDTGFVRSFRAPNRGGIKLSPVIDGWVAYELGPTAGMRYHLTWHSPDFEDSVVLADWEQPMTGGSIGKSIRGGNGKPDVTIAMPAEQSQVRVSRDGRLVYFKEIGTRQVTIFDVATKKPIDTIDLTKYGEGLIIDLLRVDAFGNLWAAVSHGKQKHLVFDRSGDPTTSPLTWEMTNKILDIRDDWVFWLLYDLEADDPVLAACRVTDLEAFTQNFDKRFELGLSASP